MPVTPWRIRPGKLLKERAYKETAKQAVKLTLKPTFWIMNLRKTRATFQPASLTGRIVFDFYNMSKAEEGFKEAKKRLLKKYSIKRIGKLQSKHMKNPERFKREFDQLINEFVNDYKRFLGMYQGLFQYIVDTINAAQSIPYSELIKMEDVLVGLKKVAANSPAKLYFPEEGKVFSLDFVVCLNLLWCQQSI